MRSSWVAICALAVIGAFFFSLQILWLLRVEPEWLPYPVNVVSAILAGGAMANAAPIKPFREPIAAGVLAIVILAAITFLLPRAFTLTAARIDQRWVVLPIVAVVSGLACGGGAWLFSSTEVPRSLAIGAVAAMVGACAIWLGGGLGYALGLPVSLAASTIEMAILGLLSGVAVQSVVAGTATGPIAVGVAVFVGFGIVARLAKGAAFDATVIATFVPILTAAIGARMVATEA